MLHISESPINTPYNVVVPRQIIVDNTDAGFSIVSGLWGTSTWTSYGGSFRYAPRGAGASVAQWTTALGMTGQWEVEAWWPNFRGGTNVPYTVMHDGGTDTFQVNQKNHNANQWNSLGVFAFTGGTATVQLSNLANGWVFADAMRFTYVG